MPLRAPLRTAATLAAFALLAPPRPSTAQARAPATRAPAAVVIIAHPGVPVPANGLTLAQLQEIFLARRQFWTSGRRIRLLVREPEASERRIVLQQIYGMTEEQYSRYWLRMRAAAEVGSDPQPVKSPMMARLAAAQLPGAISFVPDGQQGSVVRVLRIDGKLPGDPGYPLQCAGTGEGGCRFPR
jgi:hypothetical protein